MYPEHNQLDPDNPDCREESGIPTNPDSEYGWGETFSERLYFSYNRNYGIPVRVSQIITSSDLKEPGKVEERKRWLAICP